MMATLTQPKHVAVLCIWPSPFLNDLNTTEVHVLQHHGVQQRTHTATVHGSHPDHDILTSHYKTNDVSAQNTKS